MVDLSIGTPVDASPSVLQAALAAGADAPGYPTALGTPALRTAAADWLARRLGVTVAEPHGPDPSVIPTVGSKELVALLPTLLGLSGSGTVLIPEVAYPTYEVGAVLAGLAVRRCDVPPDDATGVVLVWLNSPGNPHGRVLTDDELRAWAAWAARGACRSWPTSATSPSAGTSSRAPCCTRPWPATTTAACSRCTPSPSSPTPRATAPGCSRVTRRWCARRGRCAGTSGCSCPARCRTR